MQCRSLVIIADHDAGERDKSVLLNGRGTLAWDTVCQTIDIYSHRVIYICRKLNIIIILRRILYNICDIDTAISVTAYFADIISAFVCVLSIQII